MGWKNIVVNKESIEKELDEYIECIKGFLYVSKTVYHYSAVEIKRFRLNVHIFQWLYSLSVKVYTNRDNIACKTKIKFRHQYPNSFEIEWLMNRLEDICMNWEYKYIRESGFDKYYKNLDLNIFESLTTDSICNMINDASICIENNVAPVYSDLPHHHLIHNLYFANLWKPFTFMDIAMNATHLRRK